MNSAAQKKIRIGGASGYWGESTSATPQLLKSGDLDYIVFDYLAEITMSILARARAKDPNAGFAADFVSAVIKPNLKLIAESGVKIISNAGGVNPAACAVALRQTITDAGLDLKVAVVTGDDLISDRDDISSANPVDMFSGDAFPPSDTVASINAYLGAFPIAQALKQGADIVVTGRCVDSAVTLGALIYEFNWQADDWDKLSAGSLAGHILECGPQATGGNFTDWEAAGDIVNIGYPIADVDHNGDFTLSKPTGTGGLVNVGTVSEQLLYEIGDPQNYILPDVTCDFSKVTIKQDGDDRVHVSGAKGRPAPDHYKTCLTYHDGYRAGMLLTVYGESAERKAHKLGDAIFSRARNIFRQFNAGDFTQTSIEIIGAESQFGVQRHVDKPREVVLKLAAKHPTAMGVGIMLKEAAGIGLATPPGLSIFSGGRPKPSPVVRLFSYLTPKAKVEISLDVDGNVSTFKPSATKISSTPAVQPAPPTPLNDTSNRTVPLIKLAWARSGDKGDNANIGVIARKPEYLPYIWQALDEDRIADTLAHFIASDDKSSHVKRFFLPGPNAINFLITSVLGGGGVASLRNDPQGKGYGQLLLALDIPVPQSISDTVL